MKANSDWDKMIEFEEMQCDCPWLSVETVGVLNIEICAATKLNCSIDNCALFHWVDNLRSRLHISVVIE